MAYFAAAFTQLVCFAPFIYLIFILFKSTKKIVSFFAGCACFVVFQVLTRMPLLSMLSQYSTDYLLFSSTQPLANAFLLSLSAGVFEETGRYIVFSIMKKRKTDADPISFGLGHGGIEAVLLVAIPFIQSMAMKSPFTAEQAFCSGLERISAITLHVALSILVYRCVKAKKGVFVLLAVALHTLFNVVALFSLNFGMSLLLTEILLLAVAVIIYVCTNKFFILKAKENEV